MLVRPIRSALFSICFRIAFVMAVVFAASSVCMAQVAGGTIFGSVKDISGAAVQKARVTVVNTETHVSREIEVNDEGIYTIPNLVPGSYDITAVATEFGTVVRYGVTVSVGEQATVEFQM